MEEKREAKSRRHILNAFIALRSKKDLEKIKVIEICQLAEINKSTFYTYYHDIYDLSTQMQQEIIDRIALTLPRLENAIEDTESFTKDVLLAYEANKEQIRTMFSGTQSYRLPQMVKEKVISIVREYRGEAFTEESLVRISFKIYGAYYAFLEKTDMNEMDKIDFISRLSGENDSYS